MKKIVVSGINATEVGVLSIFYDFLNALTNNEKIQYEIIALVHKKELFSSIKNVKFIEFPKSKKSWFLRIYYEFYYFKKLSLKIKPYIWFSIHDITPNVVAEKQFVYCHNIVHYHKIKLSDFLLTPTGFLFSFFYKYLYFINHKKNTWVIVQQENFRFFFAQHGITNVIVAKPEFKLFNKSISTQPVINNSKFTFFYPSFPRLFKNFEIIFSAVKILQEKGIVNYKVILTFDKTTNFFAKKIIKKYQNLVPISFIGIITRKEVYEWYEKTNVLLFPSKLESWGLPISEFKPYNKPILVADLPYARENIGDYNKTLFFNTNNPLDLAKKMELMIQGEAQFTVSKSIEKKEPYCNNWEELINFIIYDDKR